MGWLAPNTVAVGDPISASNHNTYIRDNLNYLLQRNSTQLTYYPAGNYTYSLAPWTTVDATNVKLNITPQSTRVMGWWIIDSLLDNTAHNAIAYLSTTITGGSIIDGDSTNGTTKISQPGSANARYKAPLTFAMTGLTANSATTLYLYWKTDASAGVVLTLFGSATQSIRAFCVDY